MKAFFSRIGRFFSKNWSYKLIALLVGVGVWVYVLNVVNPPRDKRIDNVSISFQGQTDLQKQGLTIVNSRAVLPEASVVVSAKAMQRVSPSLIRAYVDLQNVRTPGTYKLYVQTSTTVGSTVEVTPMTVDVEVDWLKQKRIPVKLELTGTLPDGYWNDTPRAIPEIITISGAEQLVERVTKAVCYIDLTDRTDSYYDSMNVVLYDEDSKEIANSTFLDSLPSVIVDMTVLPKKMVPIDLADSIVGKENIPKTYEITDITLKPDEIEVVGKQEELDKIESLKIGTVNLGDGKQSITEDVSIIKPSRDLTFINTTSDKVQVHVEITEKEEVLNFVDMPIAVRNVSDGLEASQVSPQQVSVNVTVPTTQLNYIDREKINVYVDAKDLTTGTYKLPVQFSLPDEAENIAVKLSQKEVTVTITEQEQE